MTILLIIFGIMVVIATGTTIISILFKWLWPMAQLIGLMIVAFIIFEYTKHLPV